MARPNPKDSATILIVENEGLVRRELVYGFREMGLLVLEAQDADEAIALLNEHPEVRLMVTDIRMSGSMDGVRLAHHVRKRWPPVKIIVASGWPETQPRDLPARSVLIAKPYEQETLWLAAAELLGGRVEVSAGPGAA